MQPSLKFCLVPLQAICIIIKSSGLSCKNNGADEIMLNFAQVAESWASESIHELTSVSPATDIAITTTSLFFFFLLQMNIVNTNYKFIFICVRMQYNTYNNLHLVLTRLPDVNVGNFGF